MYRGFYYTKTVILYTNLTIRVIFLNLRFSLKLYLKVILCVLNIMCINNYFWFYPSPRNENAKT